jgi:peptidoglycan/LPS O-acetylase OafA/YrhL
VTAVTATADLTTGAPAASRERGRLVGLDGIRGFAALFVVLHHCYLMAFPGFPANTGPAWLAWLLYGHISVVVFIVLSGFSLGVSPARSGWRLSSLSRFAHRRAWRILPPYWAALVFSLLVAWFVVPQPGSTAPTGKTVAVYGLLLQDVFGAPNPNGAFWSIAVEAQLYFTFPLLLLVLRRWGPVVMVGSVAALVAGMGLLAPHVHAIHLLMRLTPQFAALFALGLAAAGIVVAGERIRRLPLQWFAALAAAPVLVLLAVQGSGWWNVHMFWIDLAVGPATALLLAAVATRRPVPLVRLLDTRPVRSLGSFSYSLYLIHAPIVVAVNRKLVEPHLGSGQAAFWVTFAIAVPLSVVAARLFGAVFEIPFVRHRSWAALRSAIRAKLGRPEPATEPSPS